jgi:hypothetical protein
VTSGSYWKRPAGSIGLTRETLVIEDARSHVLVQDNPPFDTLETLTASVLSEINLTLTWSAA